MGWKANSVITEWSALQVFKFPKEYLMHLEDDSAIFIVEPPLNKKGLLKEERANPK